MKRNAHIPPPAGEDIPEMRRYIAQLEKLEIKHRQTEKIQAALYRIADAANSADSMKELYSTLHQIIGEFMYAKNFYIAMYDETTEMINSEYFVDDHDSPKRPPQKLEKGGMTAYVIRTGQPMLLGLPEVMALAEQGEIIIRGKTTEDIHWLGIPLKTGDRILGMLAVQSYTKDVRYTEKDKDLLIFVSQHIATALQRKQAEEALKKAYDDLERRVEERTNDLAQTNLALQTEIAERQQAEKVQSALFRIADAASTAADMQELYANLHTIVGELMDASNFYISLYDEASGAISFPYFVDAYDKPPKPRKLKKGLTEYVLSTGESLLTSRTFFNQLVQKGRIEVLNEPPVYWLGVPLKRDRETFGVLTVQSYSEKVHYTEKDKELLTFVSQHIATALQRKQAEQALKQNEKKLQNLSNQMEQFSRAATSMLSIRDEQTIFDKISTAIVEHSDFRRVIISLFKKQFPYRDIIGYGGISRETVNRLKDVELNRFADCLIPANKVLPTKSTIPI